VTSRYEPLLALARRERELIDANRWHDLHELGAEWQAHTENLPDPSPADREVLDEIAATVWSTVAAVQAALADTTRGLGHVQRGRLAVGSYGTDARHAALDARG
jgi:hypothetical protein